MLAGQQWEVVSLCQKKEDELFGNLIEELRLQTIMQMDFSGENLTRHYQDMEERSGLRSRYCSRDHTYYRQTGIKLYPPPELQK